MGLPLSLAPLPDKDPGPALRRTADRRHSLTRSFLPRRTEPSSIEAMSSGQRNGQRKRPWGGERAAPRARLLAVMALLFGVGVMHGLAVNVSPATAAPMPAYAAGEVPGGGMGGREPCRNGAGEHPPAHETCPAVVNAGPSPGTLDRCDDVPASASHATARPRPGATPPWPSTLPRPPNLAALCVLRI